MLVHCLISPLGKWTTSDCFIHYRQHAENSEDLASVNKTSVTPHEATGHRVGNSRAPSPRNSQASTPPRGNVTVEFKPEGRKGNNFVTPKKHWEAAESIETNDSALQDLFSDDVGLGKVDSTGSYSCKGKGNFHLRCEASPYNAGLPRDKMRDSVLINWLLFHTQSWDLIIR